GGGACGWGSDGTTTGLDAPRCGRGPPPARCFSRRARGGGGAPPLSCEAPPCGGCAAAVAPLRRPSTTPMPQAVELRTRADAEAMLAASHAHPVVLLKHSALCFGSARG